MPPYDIALISIRRIRHMIPMRLSRPERKHRDLPLTATDKLVILFRKNKLIHGKTPEKVKMLLYHVSRPTASIWSPAMAIRGLDATNKGKHTC